MIKLLGILALALTGYWLFFYVLVSILKYFWGIV